VNTAKLRVTGIAGALISLAAVVVWQQWRFNRLLADADVLRTEVEQAATVRDENQRLAQKLRLVSERSEASLSELARLRGQTVRMRQVEQENARLKAERERLARQPAASTPTVPDEQTPEWEVAQQRMYCSKVLGLSIWSFAKDNQGWMPTNELAFFSQTEQELNKKLAKELPVESENHEISFDPFELVFQGNLHATGREPGSTIIARTTEPIQLSNGRWARPCVFDDGHSEVLVADTLPNLATKEKELMQTPTTP